jgi:lysophospholipase L1-like esterase
MTQALKRKPLLKLIAVVLPVVIFFLLLEVTAGLLITENRLDRILALLEQDARIFWKQKDNLDMDFFGGWVNTDDYGMRLNSDGGERKPGDYRVLVLGASPSFGWGVQNDETYSAILERELDKRFIPDIRVVNGCGVGYSSFQGLGLLKRHIARIKPHVVTVSFVINDVDNYRFFRNTGQEDKAVEPLNGFTTAAGNVMDRFAFYRGMKKIAAAIASKAKQGEKAVDYSVFPGENRVSIDDYRANLLEFIQVCRRHDARLIFIEMPVNLPEGPAVVSEEQGAAYYEKGKQAFLEGRMEEAEAALSEAVKHNPIHSKAYYYLGQCAAENGDTAGANRYFTRVKECESFNCSRDSKRYNAVMERVAAEHGIPLVDIVAAYEADNAERDRYLFLDPNEDTIHPNKEGHAIIGRQLTKTAAAVMAEIVR